MSLSDVKALTFDVFGTVVDWRSSVIRECRELGRARGIDVDWAEFADRWRDGYAPAMARVRSGELPWTKIDALHRMILDGLLEEFGVTGLSEGGERPLEPRLAQARAVAGFRSGTDASARPVHRGYPVQRQRGAADQHGKARGAALGLHPIG